MSDSNVEREYLCYAPIMGGGTWSRGPGLEAHIKKCAKSVRQDWGSVFKLKGKAINIGVFDVTDVDQVRMDGGCAYIPDATKPGGVGEYLKPLEIREVTL